MTGGGMMNRRRFLQALAAVGVVVACGPTATPSPSPSSAGVSPAPKPVSIEWWRLNYAAGTQSAETITSDRSEEHTSELQSRGHLVCRLLLEKKKNNII